MLSHVLSARLLNSLARCFSRPVSYKVEVLIIGPPGRSQHITILFKDNSEETTNLLGLINEFSNVAEI